MGLPAVAPAVGFVSRFAGAGLRAAGVAITRAARAAGARMATIYGSLRKHGFQGSSVGDLLSWIKNNKGAFMLTVAAFADVGIDVLSLVKGGEDGAEEFTASVDPEDRKIIEVILAGESEAQKLVHGAASASERADVSIAERASDLAFTQAVLTWARRHYGSVDAAIKAHQLHQAFFEMPYDDVVVGMTYVRTQ